MCLLDERWVVSSVGWVSIGMSSQATPLGWKGGGVGLEFCGGNELACLHRLIDRKGKMLAIGWQIASRRPLKATEPANPPWQLPRTLL